MPPSFKSTVTSPLARLFEFGRDRSCELRHQTSNPAAEAVETENDVSAAGGCGAGRPGKPMVVDVDVLKEAAPGHAHRAQRQLHSEGRSGAGRLSPALSHHAFWSTESVSTGESQVKDRIIHLLKGDPSTCLDGTTGHLPWKRLIARLPAKLMRPAKLSTGGRPEQ